VRQVPTDLADEIAARGGPWALSSARFRPPDDCKTSVSILLSEEGLLSEIAIDKRPLRSRSRDAAALRQAGYEILAIRRRPFLARRLLRGQGELDAEVERLVALLHGQSAVASFPSRLPRRRKLPAGNAPFSTSAFERMRNAHRWVAQYVTVSRRGKATILEAPHWSIAAWCLFVNDEDVQLLNFHVQLFRRSNKAPRATEFATLERTLRTRLAPLGYSGVVVHGANESAIFATFDKRVDTLAAARRERARLDRVLFGD